MKRRTLRAALPALLLLLGVGGIREAAAQRDRGDIPAETVVRARMDERVSSRNAQVGDRFTATVVDNDRSGFPEGTKLQGTVSEVQHSTKDQPGILDMRFKRAVLPDGTAVAIDGRLASLSDEDTRRTRDGRIESRRSGDKGKFDPKWVGYGAAGGAVLATIFGGGFLKGALLGGLGGAVYAYLNKDKNKNGDSFREATIDSGTEFGVRMAQSVAFDRRPNYRYGRGDRVDRNPGDRVAGARQEYRYGASTVMLNGRRVDFTGAKPVNLNGTLYVPLAPVAAAANMRYDYQPGDDSFTLRTPNGEAEGFTGETNVSMSGRNAVGARRDERLEAPPVAIDGEIYVPTEYLTRVAGMHVNWDRRSMRLELDTTP